MPKPKKLCPVHGDSLERSKTRYGFRFDCTRDECTVMCWGGSTSTPANQTTRDARIAAHAAFDVLWQDGKRSRTKAYKWLANAMQLSGGMCHIGMFNAEQCASVVALCADYSGVYTDAQT